MSEEEVQDVSATDQDPPNEGSGKGDQGSKGTGAAVTGAEGEYGEAVRSGDSDQPWRDPGPERPEDSLTLPGPVDDEGNELDPVEVTAEEIDMESKRKDETSVLASDRFDSEGNRIQ